MSGSYSMGLKVPPTMLHLLHYMLKDVDTMKVRWKERVAKLKPYYLPCIDIHPMPVELVLSTESHYSTSLSVVVHLLVLASAFTRGGLSRHHQSR